MSNITSGTARSERRYGSSSCLGRWWIAMRPVIFMGRRFDGLGEYGTATESKVGMCAAFPLVGSDGVISTFRLVDSQHTMACRLRLRTTSTEFWTRCAAANVLYASKKTLHALAHRRFLFHPRL